MCGLTRGFLVVSGLLDVDQVVVTVSSKSLSVSVVAATNAVEPVIKAEVAGDNATIRSFCMRNVYSCSRRRDRCTAGEMLGPYALVVVVVIVLQVRRPFRLQPC